MNHDAIACLHCHVPMVKKTYAGVIYDECPQCRAHWFDLGELQTILHGAGVTFDEATLHKGLEQPTRCRWCETQHDYSQPDCGRCHRPLVHHCPKDKRAMMIAQVEHIELDHCTTCKGLWFDGEEFSRLLAHERRQEAADAGDRPQGMPEWAKLPNGVTGENCQICGKRQAIRELHWDHGLLKCASCVGPDDPKEADRLQRLRHRNQRKWQPDARPVTEGGWLEALSGWFKR